MSSLTVSFKVYTTFSLPEGVKLLPPVENDIQLEKNTPFTWWIKYNTLYYIDADGNEQEVEGDVPNSECMKWHDHGSEQYVNNTNEVVWTGEE